MTSQDPDPTQSTPIVPTYQPAAAPQRPAPPTSPSGRLRAADVTDFTVGRWLCAADPTAAARVTTHRRAGMASAALRLRAERRLHLRGDPRPRRSVVLRDDDPRARPSPPRLGRALATPAHRARRVDRAGSAGPPALNEALMPDDWQSGDRSFADRLWLADWRVQVAALYSEVRALAAVDPAGALAHWRATRERLFREHPQSPVRAAERSDFRARHFDHDPGLRFTVPIVPAPPPAPGALALDLPNSGEDTLSFARLGQIELPLPADPGRSRCSGWPVTPAGSSSLSVTRRTARRRIPQDGTWWTGRKAPIWVATPPRAPSPSTSTTPTSHPAPSTHAGRARSHHPRIASMSRSARASGSPEAGAGQARVPSGP